MDFESGPVMQCRRLPRAELRSSQILHRRTLHRRLFVKCREPSFGGILQNKIPPATIDRILRSELCAVGGAVERCAARMVRSNDSSAHAHVPYGTLRFLRFSFARHGLL